MGDTRLPHRHGQPRSNEVTLFLLPPHTPWSFPHSCLYFLASYFLLLLPFDIFLALVSFLFSSHCSCLLSHLPLTQPTFFALSAHLCAFPQIWPPPSPEGYSECILFTPQREEAPLLHRSRKRINIPLSHAILWMMGKREAAPLQQYHVEKSHRLHGKRQGSIYTMSEKRDALRIVMNTASVLSLS